MSIDFLLVRSGRNVRMNVMLTSPSPNGGMVQCEQNKNRPIGWNSTRSVSLVSCCNDFSVESFHQRMAAPLIKQGTKRYSVSGKLAGLLCFDCNTFGHPVNRGFVRKVLTH